MPNASPPRSLEAYAATILAGVPPQSDGSVEMPAVELVQLLYRRCLDPNASADAVFKLIDEGKLSLNWTSPFGELAQEMRQNFAGIFAKEPGLFDDRSIRVLDFEWLRATTTPVTGRRDNERTADTKTDKRKKLPTNPDVSKAAKYVRDERQKISRPGTPEPTLIQMLSDFADGDQRKAQSLARQFRPDRYGWLLEI